ncbi:hypothetical protein GCM10029964_078140 [Kibdelosporangium lantanae]
MPAEFEEVVVDTDLVHRQHGHEQSTEDFHVLLLALPYLRDDGRSGRRGVDGVEPAHRGVPQQGFEGLGVRVRDALGGGRGVQVRPVLQHHLKVLPARPATSRNG